MRNNFNALLLKISDIVRSVLDDTDIKVNKDTILLGEESLVRSRELVEILLEIEDFMEDEFSFEFDWSSNSAMSEANSNYKTITTLTNYLLEILKKND